MNNPQDISVLIKRIKEGDEQAFSLLLLQFEPLILSSVSRFCTPPAYQKSDFEDLRQEAVLALFKAAGSFDEEMTGITFGLYAKICIKNRLISAKRQKLRSIRKIRDTKGNAFQKKVGRPRKIPAEQSSKKSGKSSFKGTLPTETQLLHLLDLAEKDLTAREKRAFDLYLSGSSYKEIGEELHCDIKSVDNALSRAKKKIKKYADVGQKN